LIWSFPKEFESRGFPVFLLQAGFCIRAAAKTQNAKTISFERMRGRKVLVLERPISSHRFSRILSYE
jgi:hypothetical protein